ncbi:MAG: sugar ABC transporter permease [Gracilibacteraceae bacterium]|nr:sugar ABC transporter permease [Gracilibacteraceae bacterium]
MKRMGFKESLFILPAIIIIAIFSLWPILKVINYSVFDYQLNDQQKSKLSLDEKFNVDLFNENADYVIMFIDMNRFSFPEDTQGKVDEVINNVYEFKEILSGKSGFIELSGDLKGQVRTNYNKLIEDVDFFINNFDFPDRENLKLVMEDTKKCFVQSNFIGLAGYGTALKDKRMHDALWHTVVFTIISVALELILGLGLAIIMNKAMKGQGVVRAVSLIPWAIPTTVAALMWSYLYDGSNGIVANILQKLHIISDSRNLLLSGGGAMASAILADVWKTTPYMALLILAGFQTIPGAVYESAKVDGSGVFNTFFKITLPLLKPSILVALLMRTLDAFRVFDLIYVLTGGGPGGSTETMSIYAYKTMFQQTNFGYGSVIVLLMVVCVAIIATFYIKILGANAMERD